MSIFVKTHKEMKNTRQRNGFPKGHRPFGRVWGRAPLKTSREPSHLPTCTLFERLAARTKFVRSLCERSQSRSRLPLAATEQRCPSGAKCRSTAGILCRITKTLIYSHYKKIRRSRTFSVVVCYLSYCPLIFSFQRNRRNLS